MKNKEDRKKTIIICSITALCIAVLVGAYFLTREPEAVFIPAPADTADQTGTDTWEENTDAVITPAAPPQPASQITGSPTDNTQSLVSEDGNGSTSSLSDSTTKEEAAETKPSEKPEADGDTTDPEQPPSYAPPVSEAPEQETTPSGTPDADVPPAGTGSAGEHPGQVYDPVFGWIDAGATQQDNVDSDGDINKQIGTMGGN